jgi:hypothetical protein
MRVKPSKFNYEPSSTRAYRSLHEEFDLWRCLLVSMSMIMTNFHYDWKLIIRNSSALSGIQEPKEI